MKKCREFIDKVHELTFIKIKERQVNKFSKLIKKQGNITWFSVVSSVCNPWANNSSGEHADAQKTGTGTNTQGVSASPPGSAQVPQAGADIQAISAPSPASPVRSQAPQAENTDAQAVSTSPPASSRQALMPRHPVLSPSPPMTTHWKITTPNGSSTCLANL